MRVQDLVRVIEERCKKIEDLLAERERIQERFEEVQRRYDQCKSEELDRRREGNKLLIYENSERRQHVHSCDR
jgi:hypothetical protein